VQAGTHPDLSIIYRQLNREHPDSTIRKQKALNISVDVIRQFVIERVNRRPMRGRAKVFIVREAERLTDAAQNSLLKTLEEPPPDTFIMLITSALDRMLPTTKSRCQPVVFQPLPADFVSEQLRSMRPETAAEELEFAARHSAGSLGAALRFIDDGLFAMKRPWGEHLLTLVRPARGFAPHLLAAPFIADAKTIGKQVAERDPDMSDTDATRVGLQSLMAVMAGFYLDAQRRVTGAAVETINVDQPEIVDALAGVHSPRQLVTALQQIAQADAAIGRNANLELSIESMFVGLAAAAQGRPVRRIAS
jgi:DNA polymerase-3 subunit delta'